MLTRTILVIDDHALFRSGIVAMLAAAFPDVAVHETGTLDGIGAESGIAPAVVLLDIQLGGQSGLDGIPALRRRWPAARIVVVSGIDGSSIADEAVRSGADMFLSKTQGPDQMIAVLRALIDGSDAEQTLGASARATLTPRQLEVLELLNEGLSNKAIGRRLGVSEHTVRGHVQATLASLGAASRSQAAFAARRLGLIR